MIRSSVYGDVYSNNGYTLLSLNCQVPSSEFTIPMNALSQQRSRFMCHFTYPQSVLFFIPFTPAREARPIGVLRSPHSPCQSNKCPTPVGNAETFGPTQSCESILALFLGTLSLRGGFLYIGNEIFTRITLRKQFHGLSTFSKIGTVENCWMLVHQRITQQE